ncbi:LysR family transcriptional regulator [Romboutsia maritimum]|uniref:LysR family transcriptional regulator n=1 Tax=Romboutsia maritimum TaxID=2020948 RepID=A0A371ITX7_9FIRM|nr:LysR family transcriptional regulator [Romboutsia maritimum]RDY23944.1 LysR family transcriptional regulator [Romboutsia maritimum]
MELLQLKYFLTVARTEHMTNAAKELHIVQPALSKTISLLEKELGFNLFDRRGKYINLNENGKFFFSRVNESLSILDDSIKELKDKNCKIQKEIKVLVLSGSKLITDIIIEFKKIHPEIILNTTQNLYNTSSYTHDLCIYSSEEFQTDKDSILLLKENILLGVPIDHPLSSKKSIKLSEVHNEKFITLNHGNFKKITDSFCKSAGFTPNITFESNNSYVVRNLIQAGQGISFIPEKSWCFDKDNSIKMIKITSPKCVRNINLSIPNDRYLSKEVILFKDFLINSLKNLN